METLAKQTNKQKKNPIPFLSNTSKEIKATGGHFASMNITFFNRIRKETLCNNTQLELSRKQRSKDEKAQKNYFRIARYEKFIVECWLLPVCGSEDKPIQIIPEGTT